ncbi:glycosyltransferase family 1 protein [Lactobacillus helveticus]|uniref:Glycosyltransferase family 1 protein n=1 Tax=Lactobacillus helveticus TaxID=1587 RepID=A0AAC8W9Q1_LACHE|nr:glycosyltransferase family 1 protein [Lactobacillus helveticus]ALI53228.1 hypothetical protein ALV80_09535 [Lactobacillus helveticus]
MKKILQIGMTSNYGGIESFVMNVYRNIDRSRFQFDFINMELNGKDIAYSDEIKSLGGKIYKIPGRRENLIENRKQLRKIIQTNDYDFVHNNVLTWSYSYGITLPLSYSTSRVIVHSHNSYMNSGMYARRTLNFINRRLNYKNNIIRLACSKEAGYWLFRDKLFQIIPNGIDTDAYTFNAQIRDEYRSKFDVKNKKVFLNVGRLSYQKNHLFLLKWFKKIHQEEKNSVLFLVGDGELRNDLEEKARELGIASNVKFLGIRNDVKNIMFMSDALLFPSFYEGLPVVLVEAQATGLPAIISDTISSEIDLTNGIRRIDISNSPESYAELALRVAENSYELDRKKAHLKVRRAGYDISNTVKILEKIYRN